MTCAMLGESAGDVCKRVLRRSVKQPLGRFDQSGRCPGRYWEEKRMGLRRGQMRLGGVSIGRLFHNGVGVGPSKAERVDGGNAGQAVVGGPVL